LTEGTNSWAEQQDFYLRALLTRNPCVVANVLQCENSELQEQEEGKDDCVLKDAY
jgi:hypothetical protein